MSNIIFIKKTLKPFNKTLKIEGDKSLSIRWALLASQAVGKSSAKNILKSEDVLSTLKCLKKLGVKIKLSKNKCIMNGVGIEKTAKWCYDAANEHLDAGTTPNGARCVKVEVWEHEGNSAIYSGPGVVEQDDSRQLLFEDLKDTHSESDEPGQDKKTWDMGTTWI